MNRLHVLVVIASFIIALRGLQVLQLFGVVPKPSARRTSPSCLNSGPFPPYAAKTSDASSDSSSRSRSLLQVTHWLKLNGADIQHVTVGEFDGLRGLQVNAHSSCASHACHISTCSGCRLNSFCSASYIGAAIPYCLLLIQLQKPCHTDSLLGFAGAARLQPPRRHPCSAHQPDSQFWHLLSRVSVHSCIVSQHHAEA
jgi:hypothetical protein